MKNKKITTKIIAAAVALTTAAGASIYAFADGDHNQDTSDGIGGKTTHGEWFVDDNNHAPTVENAKWFIRQMNNGAGKIAKGSDEKIQGVLTGAIERCQARGGTNCRLVAVGAAITDGDGYYSARNVVGSGKLPQYYDSLKNFSNKQLSYNGSNYTILTPFNRVDGSKTTVVDLGVESMDITGANANINVIVLAEGEPKTDYHLSVSTQQQGGFPVSGSTTPVHDSIMTSNDAGQSELMWSGFCSALGVF